MRSNFFYLFIILFIAKNTQAQNTKPSATNYYKATYIYKTNNTNSHKVFLYFSSKDSWYFEDYNGNSYKVDGDFSYNITISPRHYIYLHNFKNQTIKVQRNYNGKAILHSTFPIDTDWVITDKTKKINGHLVRKAYQDSKQGNPNKKYYAGKVIAWFTTDIPLPAGPINYGGLPGLILQMYYEKYTSTNITIAAITPVEESEITHKFKFEKGAEVSKENVNWFTPKHMGLIRRISRQQ